MHSHPSFKLPKVGVRASEEVAAVVDLAWAKSASLHGHTQVPRLKTVLEQVNFKIVGLESTPALISPMRKRGE